jgi:hypothetical protein
VKAHVATLRRLGACSDAVEYAKGHETLQAAWDACPRADWMLWLMGKAAGGPRSQSRRRLVLVACACAREALPLVRKGEGRPLAAIELAERWARGERGISISDLRAAADAAYAAYAYAAAAAARAAYAATAAAAATAAYAAAAYAAAAYAAAAAAAAYAAAAAAAAATYARAQMRARCADIVRQHQPKAPRVPARKKP